MKRISAKGIIRDIRNFIELERESGLSEFMSKAPARLGGKEKAGDFTLYDKRELLASLKEEAASCSECELHETRRSMVFGEGSPDASLMFVGEAPGLQEDIQARPFVGKAGALLTKIIEAIGLKREQVYIANCLKCRPPKNRNPLPSEIIACREFLIRQVEIIRPKVICCLGKFSAQTILISDEPITRLRGRFYDLEGIGLIRDAGSADKRGISNGVKVVPTFHPAYLLRNPSEKKLVWEDMKKIRDYIKR